MKTLRILGLFLVVGLVGWGFLARGISQPAEECTVPAGAVVGDLTRIVVIMRIIR